MSFKDFMISGTTHSHMRYYLLQGQLFTCSFHPSGGSLTHCLIVRMAQVTRLTMPLTGVSFSYFFSSVRMDFIYLFIYFALRPSSLLPIYWQTGTEKGRLEMDFRT